MKTQDIINGLRAELEGGEEDYCKVMAMEALINKRDKIKRQQKEIEELKADIKVRQEIQFMDRDIIKKLKGES